MKKLTRILSLVIFISIIFQQSTIGATYAQVQQQAVVGSFVTALVVAGLTYRWLQPEEVAQPDISFCKNPWLLKDLEASKSAKNKPKTTQSSKLISFIAGIVGGFIAYQVLMPAPPKRLRF